MQDIYTHIPETNYVPRECSVAAILLFLFMVLISLVSVLLLLLLLLYHNDISGLETVPLRKYAFQHLNIFITTFDHTYWALPGRSRQPSNTNVRLQETRLFLFIGNSSALRDTLPNCATLMIRSSFLTYTIRTNTGPRVPPPPPPPPPPHHHHHHQSPVMP